MGIVWFSQRIGVNNLSYFSVFIYMGQPQIRLCHIRYLRETMIVFKEFMSPTRQLTI